MPTRFNVFIDFLGAPGQIRTADLLVRSQNMAFWCVTAHQNEYKNKRVMRSP